MPFIGTSSSFSNPGPGFRKNFTADTTITMARIEKNIQSTAIRPGLSDRPLFAGIPAGMDVPFIVSVALPGCRVLKKDVVVMVLLVVYVEPVLLVSLVVDSDARGLVALIKLVLCSVCVSLDISVDILLVALLVKVLEASVVVSVLVVEEDADVVALFVFVEVVVMDACGVMVSEMLV